MFLGIQMIFCLLLSTTFGFLSWALPAKDDCGSNGVIYVADDLDSCSYWLCTDGVQYGAFPCLPGHRVDINLTTSQLSEVCSAVNESSPIISCSRDPNRRTALTSEDLPHVLPRAYFSDTDNANNVPTSTAITASVQGFTQYNYRHIKGGTLILEASSVGQCNRLCTDDCYAFDFNKESMGCYHHNATTVCNPLKYDINVIHYTQKDCVPEGFASHAVGYQVSGGVLIATGITYMACRATCLSDPTCSALDYDYEYSSCWKHTVGTYCGAMHRNDHTTHAQRIPCLQGQINRFYKIYDNFQMIGASYIGNFSLKQCLLRCAAQDTCRALDYDTGTSGCYLHLGNSICSNTRRFKLNCLHIEKEDCLV